MDNNTLEIVLSNWNINIISFEKIKRGDVNDNWIILSSENQYVLRKIANWRNRFDLEFELNYLPYLQSHSFPYFTPQPIKTQDNKNFIEYKGSIFWLYSYIEGNIKTKLKSQNLKDVAKMMANYHDIIEKSELNHNKNRKDLFNKKSIINELEENYTNIDFNDIKSENSIFLKYYPVLLQMMRLFDSNQYILKQYPLHRDITISNLIWDKNKLIGIIDFENVSDYKDTMIKDIAVFLQNCCLKNQYMLDLHKAKIFLTEYCIHRPLLHDTVKILPKIISAGGIEDFLYHYWLFKNNPSKAKIRNLNLQANIAIWSNTNKKLIVDYLKRKIPLN